MTTNAVEAARQRVTIERVESWGKHALSVRVGDKWEHLHTDYAASIEKMETTIIAAIEQARREGMEEAAQVADKYAEDADPSTKSSIHERDRENRQLGYYVASNIAAAIRSLAPKAETPVMPIVSDTPDWPPPHLTVVPLAGAVNLTPSSVEGVSCGVAGAAPDVGAGVSECVSNTYTLKCRCGALSLEPNPRCLRAYCTECQRVYAYEGEWKEIQSHSAPPAQQVERERLRELARALIETSKASRLASPDSRIEGMNYVHARNCWATLSSAKATLNALKALDTVEAENDQLRRDKERLIVDRDEWTRVARAFQAERDQLRQQRDQVEETLHKVIQGENNLYKQRNDLQDRLAAWTKAAEEADLERARKVNEIDAERDELKERLAQYPTFSGLLAQLEALKRENARWQAACGNTLEGMESLAKGE